MLQQLFSYYIILNLAQFVQALNVTGLSLFDAAHRLQYVIFLRSSKHSRKAFLTVTDNMSPHNAAVVARCRHGSDVTMSQANGWIGSSVSLRSSSVTNYTLSTEITATALVTSHYGNCMFLDYTYFYK